MTDRTPPAPAPAPAGKRPPIVSRRALIGGVVLLAGWAAWRAYDGARVAEFSVSLETARQALEAGQVVLIDIREPAEHATGVAAGARLVPMSQLARRLQEIPQDPAQPVFLICATQNRSSATLRQLHAQGLPHVRYVHGGMSEWVRRGWPTVRPAAVR